MRHRPVDWPGFVNVFVTKALLEVCGAAGAVWGFADICKWRHDDVTNDVFRNVALSVLGVFVVRLYWHAKHWLEHEHDFPYVKIHHRRHHIIFFVQVFSAKLLLQVCGAAGAVWGASEAVGLRTDATTEAWRVVAAVTAGLFGFRWMLEVLAYCLLCRRCTENKEKSVTIARLMALVEWNQVVTIKFILEVCGAVGAVWGFSEVIRLRTEDNAVTVWRPVSLTFGAVFALRWLHQASQYVSHRTHAPLVTEPMTMQKRSSVTMPSSAQWSWRHVTTTDEVEKSQTEGDPVADKKDSDGENDDDDDVEMPSSTSPKNDDGVDDDFEKVGADLRLMETGDTKGSYNSCDEN